MFKLVFTWEFEKTFDKLKDKKTQQRIFKKILELKYHPEIGRMLAGVEDKFFGHIYRLRVGKYRVVYAIKHETEEIYLLTLGHRESVYDRI